jgi:hypothetical protein
MRRVKRQSFSWAELGVFYLALDLWELVFPRNRRWMMKVNTTLNRFGLSVAIVGLCAVGAIAQDGNSSNGTASGVGMSSASMSSGASAADKTFVKKRRRGEWRKWNWGSWRQSAVPILT